MMMDKFTIKAAEAIEAAQQRAATAGHSEISPLHLLDALLGSPRSGTPANGTGSIVVPLLEKAGGNVAQIRSILQSELNRRPKVSGGTLTAGAEFNEVLQAALKARGRHEGTSTSLPSTCCAPWLRLRVMPRKF